MPNHITNMLDVTGPKEVLQAFKDKVYHANKDKVRSHDPDFIFDFEATVPVPKSVNITCPAQTEEERKIYAENMKLYGFGDWYEAHIKLHGTKWGAYEAVEPEKIGGGLRFEFQTAWSAPRQWIITTAKMYPTLSFRDQWIDEGGGAGDIQAHDDDVTVDKVSDHDWKLEFNADYKEQYEFLTDGDYAEVLKELQAYGEDDLEWSLRKTALERIRDEDLPLIMTAKWLYDEDKEKIAERMKHVSIPGGEHK